MHAWLACQTPLHWLAVVITQAAEPAWQQAPRRGTQLLGVHGTPLPSQTRLWRSHSTSVVMAQNPVSGLQHPPRGHGLGWQRMPAAHCPLHWVGGVETHAPSRVQQAPGFGQGFGVQVVFGKNGPLQLVNEM